MSSDLAEAPLDRLRAIERARAKVMLRAALEAVGAVCFLALCFGVGYAFGPIGLRPVELIALGSGALVLGLIFARPLALRRGRSEARSRWWLREGLAKRPVLVFDGYVLLDDEVVLASTVERLERDEDKLLIRYRDPVADGPMLRELTGPKRGLDALADALGVTRGDSAAGESSAESSKEGAPEGASPEGAKLS